MKKGSTVLTTLALELLFMLIGCCPRKTELAGQVDLEERICSYDNDEAREEAAEQGRPIPEKHCTDGKTVKNPRETKK